MPDSRRAARNIVLRESPFAPGEQLLPPGIDGLVGPREVR